MDASGNFSISVLRKALSRSCSINLTDSNNPYMNGILVEPRLLEQIGFVCNCMNHWFTIRKIKSTWWDLNSLLKKPKKISDFYLSAYLASLKAEGYSIFVVEGILPEPMKETSMGLPKSWHLTSELDKPNTNKSVHMNRSRASNPRIESEDFELEAAIAASLEGYYK